MNVTRPLSQQRTFRIVCSVLAGIVAAASPVAAAGKRGYPGQGHLERRHLGGEDQPQRGGTGPEPVRQGQRLGG